MSSFFPSAEPINLSDLATQVGGALVSAADADVQVDSVAPLESANPGALSFLNNRRYTSMLSSTRAAAVIVGAGHVDYVPETLPAIVAPEPYRAFAQAAAYMFPSAVRPLPICGEGISAGAHIEPDARLEENVTVDAGAVIGAGAWIGSGAVICANAVIGPNVSVGRNTTIGPNATVIHSLIGDNVIIQPGARLGADGFGFAMGAGGHLKIVQLGRTIIQNDVEIGPNTIIDRGSNRDTIIGEGTKIDGQVMIGHNVVMGRHCVVAGTCGFAGSSTIGDYVLMGAGVGVNGHINIGTGAQLMGKTVVVEDIPAGVQYAGDPARPLAIWRRDMVKARRAWKQSVQNKDKNNA